MTSVRGFGVDIFAHPHGLHPLADPAFLHCPALELTPAPARSPSVGIREGSPVGVSRLAVSDGFVGEDSDAAEVLFVFGLTELLLALGTGV